MARNYEAMEGARGGEAARTRNCQDFGKSEGAKVKRAQSTFWTGN